MDIDKEIREPYSAPACAVVRIEPSQVICYSGYIAGLCRHGGAVRVLHQGR